MGMEFMGELGVMGFFLVTYIGIAALLLKGHKADLSAVHAHAGGGAGEAAAVPRLNKRRKAIRRDQGQPEAATGSEIAAGNDK
jgi:hypothetical protein